MTTTTETHQEVPDDLNPQYLFAMTATGLLAQIARGDIDPFENALRELADRGQHPDGHWVGFPEAARIAEERIAERSKRARRARKPER